MADSNLSALAALTPTPTDEAVRGLVERLCRAVCAVEGIDPDDREDAGPNNDAAWTRYADAIFSVLPDAPIRLQALTPGEGFMVVGRADEMPGSNGGFTMAVFKGADVPIGTDLYAAPTTEGTRHD